MVPSPLTLPASIHFLSLRALSPNFPPFDPTPRPRLSWYKATRPQKPSPPKALPPPLGDRSPWFTKPRWQIELLFRWIKQHLKLRKFLGRSENAIRLQIIAAMIAYLLLRIAVRESRIVMQAIRFAGLIATSLFVRKPVADIDRPPKVNSSAARNRNSPDQISFCYA